MKNASLRWLGHQIRVAHEGFILLGELLPLVVSSQSGNPLGNSDKVEMISLKGYQPRKFRRWKEESVTKNVMEKICNVFKLIAEEN